MRYFVLSFNLLTTPQSLSHRIQSNAYPKRNFGMILRSATALCATNS
ncbi:hypothetical protein LEP1GSC062_2775 [Leptospira alexanderi serovar Manhao 3 str. L 60]|uniref:Uncharacterized protein n=1 Tax=Leptospira alexanderi serovar Manhao 3 str. L 60 TaxID=1049759 RepID=V6I2X0_9LEPT|nr:hypothetical protein LEP1GSC062_2775 [Leptospira alexanderi serovar Manhao 3 str. L 60]